VLAHLFEHVLPRLPEGRRLDVFSGTSVGAIHAAYAAASAHWDPIERAGRIAGIWKLMRADEVFQLSIGDLVRMPLRALGVVPAPRRGSVLGGVVDVRPLEHLVATRIPWDALPGNLASGAVGALCVSCTEIRSGRVTVFMDGELADPAPWKFDPSAGAIAGRIGDLHVRASAAIPFLFPAVRLGDRFYVDGGLRMNTPLSPALRLRADRVLVVATKQHEAARPTPNYPDDVITQPSFLLGKVLDALTLDQLEVDLHRAELINAMIERGTEVYGNDFLDRINVAVRAQRGVGFRRLRTCVIRPSEDIGRIAADVHRAGLLVREVGLLHDLLVRLLARGGPEDEADLLSYVFFDKRFTERLVEMGRADARTHEAEVFALLAED
jgi:NTE family protein